MARKARDRKRQTKINFSPAAKSSPAATTSPMPYASNATSSTRPSKPKITESAQVSPSRTSRPTAIYSSSEDDIAIGTRRSMSSGTPIKNTQNSMFGNLGVDMVMSETSEDEHQGENEQVKAKIATGKRKRAPESDTSDGSAPEVTVVKAKRRRQRSPLIELSEEEETDRPRRKRRKHKKRQFTPDDDDEEESDVVEVIPARKRRLARHPQKSKSDEDDDEESDAVEIIPVRKRKHAPRQTSHEAEDHPPRSSRHKSSRKDNTREFSDEPSQPRNKKRRIARRPVTPSDSGETDEEEGDEPEDENANATEDEDDDEKEDLQEDLAFLRSSPLPDRGKLRSTHDKPKNERQKALEALKRRRAGTNEPSSSANPSRSRKIVIESESDSDSELEIIKEEPESGEEVASEPDDEEDDEIESDRDANALDMFLEDEYDEAFIDNDADAIIGEPVLGPDEMLPLVMNRMTSLKPRELFKYAIEWMVMKKIHPAFDAASPVYDITFRKLDDEVKGLANSKFSSSAWTTDFTRALRARPELNIMELTRAKKDIMDAHCEACNRRNHPASDELMFTGQPYNKETLEPIDNDSDSDESELSADSEEELNGEKATYDAQGTRIPPESKTFTLGSTCKANAQVAHTLHHWRYHLYSWVKDYLAREGHLTAEKLVQRDGWTDKKRGKAADKIIKKMEEKGEMRKLYHLYKDQMTYASEVRHDHNRGWRSRG